MIKKEIVHGKKHVIKLIAFLIILIKKLMIKIQRYIENIFTN